MLSSKCKSFEQNWLARSEGRLGDEGVAEMSEHSKVCPRCVKFEREMEKLEFRLTALGDEVVEAPPYMKTRIMAEIEAAVEECPPGLRFSLARLFSKNLVGAASIALAGFFLGAVVSEMRLDKGNQIEADPTLTLTLDYHAPDAQDVQLVGDFNGWGKETAAVLRERMNGSWVFRLSIEPGRYQYCFVVDGKKWLPDPSAPGMIPDGFGGMNSVLYVRDAGGKGDLAL